MIKTVSFAPPRAPRGSKPASARAASPSVPAKSSPREAQTAQTKAPATLDVAEVRAALSQNAAPAKKPRAAKTSARTADLNAVEDETKARTRADKSAPKPIENAPTEASAPAEKRASAPEKIATRETSAPAAEKAKPVAKRSRVPKDLAAQYGGAPESEDVPRHVAETVAPRKRLTRAKKEARSQLLRADDEVLQRLQQANVIEAKKPARRGRGWEFVCGCCGRVSRFETPAALCECGAIAVRE